MTTAAANTRTPAAPEANQEPADKSGAGTGSPAPTPKRSFSFAASFTIPVPKEIPKRATSVADLPFKDWFTENLTAGLEGKQPHMFIPDAYWVLEREAEAVKVDKSFGRSKIMDQWRKWKFIHEKGKNTTKPVEAHKGVQITAIYRTGKEPGFDEPGLSVWLLKAD